MREVKQSYGAAATAARTAVPVARAVAQVHRHRSWGDLQLYLEHNGTSLVMGCINSMYDT